MNKNQLKQITKIKVNYQTKEQTKFSELKALDKKVKRPAEVFSYVFGSIGSLVLGTGMCLAMKVIGNMMPLGIIIGVVGIAMVSVNYFIYKKILDKRKNKYKDKILAITSELLQN